jgi:predicted transcriptional regulator
MSEAWPLSLIKRYPHPAALARHARDGSVFPAIRRLEARGLLRRKPDRYLLTQRGRAELAMTHALIRLVIGK